MKVKTNELTGRALDWAVATAMGCPAQFLWFGHEPYTTKLDPCGRYAHKVPFSPTMDWVQAGPLLEQEGIGFQKMEGVPVFQAWQGTCIEYACWPDGSSYAEGPTPLVAAMRCYAALKLGDTVDVPEELL